MSIISVSRVASTEELLALGVDTQHLSKIKPTTYKESCRLHTVQALKHNATSTTCRTERAFEFALKIPWQVLAVTLLNCLVQPFAGHDNLGYAHYHAYNQLHRTVTLSPFLAWQQAEQRTAQTQHTASRIGPSQIKQAMRHATANPYPSRTAQS